MSRAFKLLRQLSQDAKDNPNVITKTRWGYRAFGRYDIRISAVGDITVTPDTREPEVFCDLRCAVMWCQFMISSDLVPAVAVLALDQELGRVLVERDHRRAKQREHDSELNEIKLSELEHRLFLIQKQISKYVAIAKYKQLKGSNSDETYRTKQ